MLIQWLGLALLVVSCLGVFHHRAADRSLRHSQVAEGNISRYVRWQWSAGPSAFFTLVRSDAEQWGRVRPFLWIYFQPHFILTMARNGDLRCEDSGTAFPQRLNADLQTHTWIQMGVVASTLLLLALLIQQTSGRYSMTLLLLPLAVSGRGLAENFIGRFSDSVEIGQLLFISAYLFLMRRAWAGRVPSRKAEWMGMSLLCLAYMMKETTIVVLPAVLAVLAGRWAMRPPVEAGYKQFVIRQAISHLFLALLLLFFVWLSQSGAYVKHYQVDLDMFSCLQRWWTLTGFPVQFAPFAVVGSLVLLGAAWAGRRHAVHGPVVKPAEWCVLALLMLLASGFFAVNVPWGAPLRKYTYLTYVFGMASAVALLAAGTNALWRQQLRPAALVWAAAGAFFLLQSLPASRASIREVYRKEYSHRAAVPLISRDIAERVRERGAPTRVFIVDGDLFQEGALPFQRFLNKEYRMTIMDDGRAVSAVKANERNFFRIFNDQPMVEVLMGSESRLLSEVDWLYLISSQRPDFDEWAAAANYELEEDWWISGHGRVARFGRRGGGG